MKNILVVLPGKNPNLKEWASEVSSEIGNLFDSSIIHEYSHWIDPSQKFIFDSEIDRIRQLDLVNNAVFIFAKSFGCLLTLVAVNEGIIEPEAAILVGFPLREARKNDFLVEDYLSSYKVETLFIQNNEDPQASSEVIEELLEMHMHANYRLHVFSRDDHYYPDLAKMRAEIERFLQLQGLKGNSRNI